VEIWERRRSDLLAEDAVRAHRSVRAVLPNCDAWRDSGGLPLTQVLTGHGVFGKYLRRIWREVTDTYLLCQEKQDTAGHRLEFCLA
jgi:hypothetical protein